MILTPAAQALERPLLAGQVALLRARSSKASAVIQFRDQAVASALGDPRCPASSTLRIASSVDAVVELELACSRWRATKQGYRYVDPTGSAGGIRRILLKDGKLLIRLGGSAFAPLHGPIAFLEAALTIGSTGVCGRFTRFESNSPTSVRAVGPTDPCLLPRPNFLVVVLDDVRADGIDWMPVLQSELIAKGVKFDNAFVPDSVCCPSRASIFTGLYALRHGTHQIAGPDGGAYTFRESGADRQTMAVWLSDAGYATGLFGKYLNAYAQTEQGLGPNGTFYIPPGWERWWAFVSPEHYGGVLGTSYQTVDENGVVTSYTDHSTDAEYSTDVSAAELRRFVSDAVGEGRPFFAYWAPYAGHGETPWILPAPAIRHNGLFASLDPWRPPSWNESDVSDKPIWLQKIKANLAGTAGGIFAATTDVVRQKQYETLLAADEQLGQILDLLADLDVDEDTFVVLVSDNGLQWGEHQGWGVKESPYEESVRVPFIIRYPRRVAAVSQGVAATALNVDIAPTIADLAGLDLPYVPDGTSLRALFDGTSPPGWRGDFLLEYWRVQRGSRLNYTGQPMDGDRVRLFFGDPRATPRASVVFEFELLGGVSPGAYAVPIALDPDTTFANLTDVAAASIPDVVAVLNPGGNTFFLATTHAEETLHFREEVDQLAHFDALEPIPDYFGVRDVANGYTWVEYETGERELYDLNADPDQLENRADNPAYQGVRAAFEARLAEMIDEVQSRD